MAVTPHLTQGLLLREVNSPGNSSKQIANIKALERNPSSLVSELSSTGEMVSFALSTVVAIAALTSKSASEPQAIVGG